MCRPRSPSVPVESGCPSWKLFPTGTPHTVHAPGPPDSVCPGLPQRPRSGPLQCAVPAWELCDRNQRLPQVQGPPRPVFSDMSACSPTPRTSQSDSRPSPGLPTLGCFLQVVPPWLGQGQESRVLEKQTSGRTPARPLQLACTCLVGSQERGPQRNQCASPSFPGAVSGPGACGPQALSLPPGGTQLLLFPHLRRCPSLSRKPLHPGQPHL